MKQYLEFAVLRERAEIDAARLELARRGLVPPPRWADRARSGLLSALRRPDRRALIRPDPVKSWDVSRTVRAIEASVKRQEAILDVGSFASAILPALSVLGYSRLCGIDLDERVVDSGRNTAIEYFAGDLTATAWPNGHFTAITAISVIEHGVPQDALFSELTRLLRPGGAFLFSTDYWPEKIDTSSIQLFGLPWTIFSADEITSLVARARDYGFAPVSEPTARLHEVQERPIQFANREYTFLYGAFVKEGART